MVGFFICLCGDSAVTLPQLGSWEELTEQITVMFEMTQQEGPPADWWDWHDPGWVTPVQNGAANLSWDLNLIFLWGRSRTLTQLWVVALYKGKML